MTMCGEEAVDHGGGGGVICMLHRYTRQYVI